MVFEAYNHLPFAGKKKPLFTIYQRAWYTYTICNVKLHNEDLSHLPISIMNEDQVGVYSMYMSTLGNRPDLFPTSAYPNASTVKKPTEYDIPQKEMTDARFTAMMTEARKYIGYPYVWAAAARKPRSTVPATCHGRSITVGGT